MRKHYSPLWFWLMASLAVLAAIAVFATGNWQAGLAWLLVLGGHLVNRLADQIIDLKSEVQALQDTLIEEQQAYIERLERQLQR